MRKKLETPKNELPEIVMTLRSNGTTRIETLNHTPTLAQQQYRDSTDINNIMKKYLKDPMGLQALRRQGVYADISGITDYQSSVDKIMKADHAFMAMPANVRERFQQSPAKLIEFLQDPKNRDEAMQLGLIEKPVSNIPPTKDTEGNPIPPKS